MTTLEDMLREEILELQRKCSEAFDDALRRERKVAALEEENRKLKEVQQRVKDACEQVRVTIPTDGLSEIDCRLLNLTANVIAAIGEVG